MVNRRNVSWYDSRLHPGQMDYESDMDFVSDCGDENSELLSETEEMENDMFDETEHIRVFDAEIESLHYETKLPAELEFSGSETVDSDSETMVPRPQTVQRELAGFKRPRKPQQPLTFAEMMNSTDISWYDFCVNPVNMDYDLVIDFGEDEKSDLQFKTKEMKSQMTEQMSVFDAEKESLQYETKLPAELEFSGSETVVPRPQSVQQELADFKHQIEAEQTLTLAEMTNSTNMSWYDLCVNNVEVDYDLVIDFSSDGEDEKSDLLSTTKEMESQMAEQTSVFGAEKESLPNETHSSAELEFSGPETVVPRPQTVQQELADFKSRLVSVQEQKNAQLKVTVNENFKKEIKDLKKRTGDLSELLNNIKTDMKYRERKLLEERKLRVVVENLTAENAATHKELAEQQESVKHQLQDKSVVCDLLKQVDHLKEKLQNRNTCFNQEKEKRLSAENQCVLYKEQAKEMENVLVEQQQKLVALEKQLQEQKNVNEDLQKICSDLKGETDESRFSGVSRDVLIENFEKLEQRHLDLEAMFSREKDEKISVEQKLTDKLENLKEQLSEKNVFIKNLQTDLDQERRFRLVSVQEQKNAQHKVTVNENFKKEIKDLKKRNGDLSEMLDNVKTDLKNRDRKLLETQNNFKHQLKQKNLICESLEKRLNKENELRLTCEEELKKTKDQMSSMNGNLKKEINDLKRRNTDLSQTLRSGQAVETKSDQMCEDLQKFKQLLHEKMSVCEELSSSLDMEKQLRVSYEAQLDSNRAIVGENSDLKELIKDLTQSNSELRVVVENLTAENAASHQELAEQLESVKHQLQDKSVVCEKLETGFTNEQKLRLQLYQQLQETSGLCESLENQLRDEQKIRLGLETELAQNRDVVSAGHDDLMTKLEQMEEKETKLRKVVLNLQLNLFRSKKQHEEELGILKEQVSELESLTTNLESQNLILRLKTERFNPDQQTETISEQNVDAAEGNESLPAENDSLAESLESQRDAPHSDTKKQEKVSVWRHFKKFVTPGCLRQHKNKQPSNEPPC
ncbi:uncharacterized protein [Nothobranchius furzeri]|uniref:uncharacterized protein n=1 Tax=Nothobranchius furzeri TaxID=105023 RepID=UPI0039048726